MNDLRNGKRLHFLVQLQNNGGPVRAPLGAPPRTLLPFIADTRPVPRDLQVRTGKWRH